MINNSKGYGVFMENLIRICKKRQEGYTKAAELVKDRNVEKLFVKYAKQSDDFEYELLHYIDKTSVNEIGEAAALSEVRGWQNFDEDLAEVNNTNIIKVCIKEEKATMGDYEDMLDNANLPKEISQIVSKQLIEITDAYDSMLNMIKR